MRQEKRNTRRFNSYFAAEKVVETFEAKARLHLKA
ncbi:MAG: hypothetical protein K0R10_1041 [Alphaproteobacteria bacterium]|jgi:hypothetical protein|nr:hypothetical protein [Alphaproteobacteria bacterium]